MDPEAAVYHSVSAALGPGGRRGRAPFGLEDHEMRSELAEREDGGESWGGREYRRQRGYRRAWPYFPIWVVFPLIFLLVRGPWMGGVGYRGAPMSGMVAWTFAWIPVFIVGMIVMRIVWPMVMQMGAPRLRREAMREMDAGRVRQLEMELVDARSELRALREKVEWQEKLLGVQGPRS